MTVPLTTSGSPGGKKERDKNVEKRAKGLLGLIHGWDGERRKKKEREKKEECSSSVINTSFGLQGTNTWTEGRYQYDK